MPGSLGYGYHESNRGEYLAQFFLAALGVSTPILRQEDIGIDFFCSLAKHEKGKLTFHSPFTVQHGSSDSKRFVYGGYNEGKPKSDELSWLFAQEVPFFVCITDRLEGRFRLYSTSPMWLLRHQLDNDLTAIELCPDENHDPLKESKAEYIGPDKVKQGFIYRVPLGKPIVDLTLTNFSEFRHLAIDSMTKAIEIEQANITLRRMGAQLVSWHLNIEPNNPASLARLGEAVFWNADNGAKIKLQTAALRNIATNLILNLKAVDDNDGVEALTPSFRLFKGHVFPPWLTDFFPDGVRQIIRNEYHVAPQNFTGDGQLPSP